MLAIAGTIVERRTGKFDPSEFQDRYQEALRELIEAEMKGPPIKPLPARSRFGNLTSRSN
jgi:DNA end-binding protein Ku